MKKGKESIWGIFLLILLTVLIFTACGIDKDSTIDFGRDDTTNSLGIAYVETDLKETEHEIEIGSKPMIVESYDYIVKSGKFEEYLQIFESERRHEIDGAYGTRFNPTCYQYFRNLYPEATDDEILKYTRVYFYFVLEDSIYVALTSSTRLQKMESVSKKSEQYTLLRVDGVGELTEKLINSNVDFLCEDTLRHSIILNEVLNKYDYKVLAETSCNVVGFNYYNLGFTQSEEFPNLGMIPISISGFNKETNRKYFYFVTTSHPSKRYFYYAEADEFYTPKDKDYFLDFVLFSGNEKISTRKIGDVVYFNSYYEDVDIEYDN